MMSRETRRYTFFLLLGSVEVGRTRWIPVPHSLTLRDYFKCQVPSPSGFRLWISILLRKGKVEWLCIDSRIIFFCFVSKKMGHVVQVESCVLIFRMTFLFFDVKFLWLIRSLVSVYTVFPTLIVRSLKSLILRARFLKLFFHLLSVLVLPITFVFLLLTLFLSFYLRHLFFVVLTLLRM